MQATYDKKGEKARARAYQRTHAYEGHPGNAPGYPDWVDSALRAINPEYHLRWNPRAAMRGVPREDEFGRKVVEREGRFEVWSRDNTGRYYHLKTVENGYGGAYKAPDQRLIDDLQHQDMARFGGKPEEWWREMVDKPNEALETSMDRHSDNAVEDGVDHAADTHTVKSGRFIQYRGMRLFSGTGGGLGSLVKARPRIHKPNGGFF